MQRPAELRCCIGKRKSTDNRNTPRMSFTVYGERAAALRTGGLSVLPRVRTSEPRPLWPRQRADGSSGLLLDAQRNRATGADCSGSSLLRPVCPRTGSLLNVEVYRGTRMRVKETIRRLSSGLPGATTGAAAEERAAAVVLTALSSRLMIGCEAGQTLEARRQGGRAGRVRALPA